MLRRANKLRKLIAHSEEILAEYSVSDIDYGDNYVEQYVERELIECHRRQRNPTFFVWLGVFLMLGYLLSDLRSVSLSVMGLRWQ
jgi:hypothetical protein